MEVKDGDTMGSWHVGRTVRVEGACSVYHILTDVLVQLATVELTAMIQVQCKLIKMIQVRSELTAMIQILINWL